VGRSGAARGVAFATVTHAAGLSSTGDGELDRRLPFDEPYRIPPTTARAVGWVRERRGRIVAVGTTVVRALESAALGGRVREGEGMATLRIGPATALWVVDAVLTGVHEPGTSHHELLRAFVDDATLRRVVTELMGRAYHSHEFGDSVLIERSRAAEADPIEACCAESKRIAFTRLPACRAGQTAGPPRGAGAVGGN
jgi:S-adenosylmethionine:tRNA ribosyltransferase-isomerase